MKPFQVNRSSWHFRVASKWAAVNRPSTRNSWWYNLNLDFCSYWRRVVIATLGVALYYTALTVVCIFGVALAASGIAMVGGMIWYALAPIWSGEVTAPTIYSWIIFAIIGVAFVALSVPYWVASYKRRYGKNEREQEDTQKSFIAQAYYSWKEKYCMPVKIVDD